MFGTCLWISGCVCLHACVFCAKVWSYAITLEACFSQLSLWTNFGAAAIERRKVYTWAAGCFSDSHPATWAHGICLSAYLSACLSARLSACLSPFLPIGLPTCLYLFLCFLIWLSCFVLAYMPASDVCMCVCARVHVCVRVWVWVLDCTRERQLVTERGDGTIPAAKQLFQYSGHLKAVLCIQKCRNRVCTPDNAPMNIYYLHCDVLGPSPSSDNSIV